MSLLDNLKNQAGKETSEENIDENTVARQERNWLVMQPKMIQVIRYFREFTDLLNQIEQSKHFDFHITKNVTLKGYKKKDFKFEVPNDNGTEGCTFRYYLKQDHDIKILVRNKVEAQSVRDALQGKNIHFILKQDENNHFYFKIDPKITTRFAFSSDLNTGLFTLSIHNYDGGWNQTINFKPGKVTEKFLDELGKYILGEENTFMDITGNRLSETKRTKLQAKLQASEKKKQQQLQSTESKQKKSGLFGFLKR